MPLPVFPRTRKWKSCNTLQPYHAVPVADKLSNDLEATEDVIGTGLAPEVAHWQELVSTVTICEPPMTEPCKSSPEARKNTAKELVKTSRKKPSEQHQLWNRIRRLQKLEQTKRPKSRCPAEATKTSTSATAANGAISRRFKGQAKSKLKDIKTEHILSNSTTKPILEVSKHRRP